jgi:periplasmic copper chaperone A
MSIDRRGRRGCRAAALAVAGLAVAAPGALAHVEFATEEIPAGSEQIVALTVPHGCDGSPTTKLAVKIPAAVTSAKPEPKAGWTITIAPRSGGGSAAVAGEESDGAPVDSITWQGGSLPDDQVDTFAILVAAPDTPGASLQFPTVQTCTRGEVAWIEPTQPGQDEPDHPLPTLTVGAKEAGGADPGAGRGTDETRANIALGVGAAGLLVGLGGLGAALGSRRRRS